MSAADPSTLGDFFSQHPFSDAERRRLAGLAVQGGTPAQLLKRYATQTQTFKTRFQKAESFPGCRPGKALYREQAIRRIVERLGESSSPRSLLSWEVYKDAAVAFIRKELAPLNKLLTEVALPSPTATVQEAFKAVCERASEYGVLPEHITTFYEIWGTPRVENLQAMLSAWLKGDENAQRRQLNNALSEIADLRLRVTKLEATAVKHENAFATGAEQASNSRDQHRSLEKRLETVFTQISDLTAASEWTAAVRTLEDRVAGLAEKLNRLAEKVKAPREQVSAKDLQRLTSETQLGIASTVSELSNSLQRQIREELTATSVGLEGKLSALASELDRRREAAAMAHGSTVSASRYKSPLIGILGTPRGPYKLHAEIDFINVWSHHLARSHDIALTFEQAVAYHCALLGSPVVICDRVLALSWLHCLAWQPFTLHMAASPTWSSEEDWAQGAEHLFGRDSDRHPRLLVIHNYDVGLPDCYLAPTLSLWALRRAPDKAWQSKLLLLPTTPDHTPSPHILEHAICFSNNDYLTGSALALKDGIRVPSPLHRELPLGADPKTVAQWATPGARITYDLSHIQRALKCRMSIDLIGSFERAASAIGRYIDEPAAVDVAMHHQVIPWVQLTYGEAKATELSRLLSTMAGDVD